MENNLKNTIRYLLYKFSFDGDLVTNLKMQKVLYYVYVWHLVNTGKPCFGEKFQAWPNGPVIKSAYDTLKVYGASPINVDFAEINDEKDLIKLKNDLGNVLVEVIDNVYEKYGTKSPFELVALTHNELPWKMAREGLDVAEKSNNEISDNDIMKGYGKK